MKKYQEIYQLIVNDIQMGIKKTGDKLPSIRHMANNHHVSINTVIAAYNLLLEEHWIRSVDKSGYFVANKQYNEKYQNISPEFINAYNGIELLNQQLVHKFAHKPGDGRYAREYMHTLHLNQYLPNLDEHELSTCLEYGHPSGYLPLKCSLTDLLNSRQLAITQDNLLLTSGTNHSLDLVIRHFLSKGDKVLVEAPGYYPLFSKLDLAGVKYMPVFRTAIGIDNDYLETLIIKHHPKIFFIQPFAHNPTGTDLSKATLDKISQLCQTYNIIVVEDDPFLLTREGKASYLYRKDAPTIYLSSFSKTLTASLRCGFIASSIPLIQSLTKLKLITVINTSAIPEAIIHDMFVTGVLQTHLTALKQAFTQKSLALDTAMQQIKGLEQFPHNSGGLYAWFTIPIDDKKIATLARTQNIFLAPGSLFFPTRDNYFALRINKFYMDEIVKNFIQNQIFKTITPN